jgi:hypothetical protein
MARPTVYKKAFSHGCEGAHVRPIGLEAVTSEDSYHGYQAGSNQMVELRRRLQRRPRGRMRASLLVEVMGWDGVVFV